jgi:hypothetical protein
MEAELGRNPESAIHAIMSNRSRTAKVSRVANAKAMVAPRGLLWVKSPHRYGKCNVRVWQILLQKSVEGHVRG